MPVTMDATGTASSEPSPTSCSAFASRVSASRAIDTASASSRGVEARSAAISAASTLSCMSAATATRSVSTASASAAAAYEATASRRARSMPTAVPRSIQPRAMMTPARMSANTASSTIPTVCAGFAPAGIASICVSRTAA